jgi:predicted N-acetyltransferase YhbS
MELELRVATPDDAAEMLRVFQTAFDDWPRPDIGVPPIEHVRWKMSLAPGMSGTPVVGLIDGRVVAALLRWEVPVKLGDRESIASCGADLALEPAYQSRGLGTPLTSYGASAASTQAVVGYATPSRNARVPRLYASYSSDDLAQQPLSLWVRPFGFSPWKAARFGLRAMRHPVSNTKRLARTYLGRRRPGEVSGVEIAELSEFDARVDRLWEAASPEFDYAMVRRAEYLNWRYCDPRGGPSTILAALEGGELVGYAVFKQAEGWGTVVDLLTHPDRVDVVAPLLEAGGARLRAGGSRGMICWLPAEHAYREAMVGARYVETTNEMAVSFWALGGSDALATLDAPSARIHCMLGDFDWV